MPAIFAKQVLDLLKQHGLVEVRCTADHQRFKDGNDHKVSVAFKSPKDTIPHKTYNSILIQMGLK